MISYIIRDGIK